MSILPSTPTSSSSLRPLRVVLEGFPETGKAILGHVWKTITEIVIYLEDNYNGKSHNFQALRNFLKEFDGADNIDLCITDFKVAVLEHNPVGTRVDTTSKFEIQPFKLAQIKFHTVYSDDMVENISKCGELEARVTYRSPYSVVSMPGGAETVRYDLGNGTPEMLVKCYKRKLEDSPDDSDHKVHITFDDPINHWELRNFFNRFGVVESVTYQNVDGMPRGAVVRFQNPEAVRQTLRGAQVRTLFLDEREIRVRPYPTA